MLSRSSAFDTRAAADVRHITGEFKAAFDKKYDGSTTFFTWDVSVWDGPDVWAPDENAEIQEWDRYLYRDYSDRIVSMEWQREESFPYSVNLAMADIVLNNYDGRFTYGLKPTMSKLRDNFSGEMDETRWYSWGGNNLVQASGQIAITTKPTSGYFGLQAYYNYDLTDSYASCQVVSAGNQSLPSFEVVPVNLQNDADNAVLISINDGALNAVKKVSGVDTILASITYNPSVHKFFRIRESAGYFYFERSTDGSAWTAMISMATTGFDVTDMRYDLFAGSYADEGTTTTALFDNMNCDATGSPYDLAAASPLAPYMLPRRPVRLLAGFSGENLPQFVGLTETAPRVDHGARTVSLHAMDFLSFIFSRPLDNTVILQDKFTHEVLSTLFQSVGLTPAQYDLDVSYNRIAFVYFEKGSKLGDAVRQLMQAELGSLYMDELGKIRFTNRLREAGAPVASFAGPEIVDYKFTDDSSIINVVEIKANVRTVQPTQPIFSLSSPVELKAGVQTEVFFNFEDPVVSLQPVAGYAANSQEDGQGANLSGNITVVSSTLFATSVKVTFSNAGPTAYLRELTLYGQPAKVTKNIYLRRQDDASVAKYEEQVLTIENDYIQDDSQADSIALSILNYYKEYASTIEITVKGSAALQLGDHVTIDTGSGAKTYQLSKISNRIMDGQFRQVLTGKTFNIPTFFKWNVSTWDGPDVWAP